MVRNKDQELFKVDGLASEEIRLIAYSLIGLLILVKAIHGLVGSGVSISFVIGSSSYRRLADQLFISNLLTLLSQARYRNPTFLWSGLVGKYSKEIKK